MTVETWFLYALVSTIAIISPGPAVLLAVTNGMSYSMRLVAASSLGNILGLFVLSSVSILGLGAILLASSALFFFVKIVGALYLLYLGLRQFRKRSIFRADSNIQQTDSKNFQQSLLEGFLVAVTNPKPIIFFIALFPSFLDTEKAIYPQFLMMTLTFMSISFCTLLVYGKISGSAKSLLYNESRMQTFNRVSGATFVAMAAGLVMVDAKK